MFIIDSSGSVGQDNFYRVLNFTYQTVDGLDIDSGQFRVGVTTFSDASRLEFNLGDYSKKQDIEQALQEVNIVSFSMPYIISLLYFNSLPLASYRS